MMSHPQYLYKWVQIERFQKYLDQGVLPVKRGYSHYIDSVGDFVKGNSFTDEANISKWTGDTLIRVDTSDLENQIYPIPGNKTYLKTMGMTKDDYDPNAWTFEPDDIDEFWIAGTLSLSTAVVIPNPDFPGEPFQASPQFK